MPRDILDSREMPGNRRLRYALPTRYFLLREVFADSKPGNLVEVTPKRFSQTVQLSQTQRTHRYT